MELRGPRFLTLVMVGAVCLVFGLAYLDLNREQRRALEDFTAEQGALSRALAGTLQARMGSVLADLDAGSRLAGSPQLEPFLRGLLERERRYREADLVSADGRVLLELPAGAAGRLSESRPLREARDAAVHRAVGGRPFISGPLHQAGAAGEQERLRLFAQAAGQSVIVLLVDSDRFFDGLAADPAPAPMRWIVVDDDHRWIDYAPTAAPAARWQLDDAQLPASVLRLLDGMGTGKPGALMLDRAGAAALGLDRRTAVAGFAPVHIAPDRTWSVAVVASAMRVRDRARVSAWRLGAATGVAGLLVGLFGFMISRQQQRSRGLAEALRLAKATAALRDDLARAEKLATIGTLAAGVAHEVGTPLGIISGRAEQLLAKLPADTNGSDPARKALTSIMSQVDKVSTTIRQLLDFARVRPVEAADVSPAQLLQTATALLEHRFRQSKVELVVDAPPTLPAVRGDAGQLEQVFVNLLMNAADACAAGGHVRALASRRGDRVLFEIVDDGCGIAPEHLPHVLDPFFTTKKRGQGTGLGLSIAADIVKNHGGQLEILGGVPNGTRVSVQLPIAKEHA